jgi:hypothetical protein
MVAFRLKYIARDIGLDHDLSIPFQAEANDAVTVELRRISDAELDKRGSRGDLLCTAELRKETTRKIRQWLESPTESLPAGFAEFGDDAFHRLAEAIIKTLRLLRWRTGHRSTRDPIKMFYSFEWSTNNGIWVPVPDSVRLESDVGIPQEKVTEEIVTHLQDLWRNNVVEPLAHELSQEAWSQRRDNPKSSLVIGIAAAETGMKQLISKLVPSSAWLVQNTQSPPLAKMLEEYLPWLPTRVRYKNGRLPPLPKSLIAIIVKAVLLRNDIAHGKEVHLELKSLREILNTVHDVLYIFDLYAGQLWAMDRVTVETKKVWLKAEA